MGRTNRANPIPKALAAGGYLLTWPTQFVKKEIAGKMTDVKVIAGQCEFTTFEKAMSHVEYLRRDWPGLTYEITFVPPERIGEILNAGKVQTKVVRLKGRAKRHKKRTGSGSELNECGVGAS